MTSTPPEQGAEGPREAGQFATLRAGVARIDITPPMPADCMGFVRRAAPATGVLAPLTATALVLEDGTGRRAVIVAMDLIALGCAQADRMREMVASAVGASPDAVLLNYSHTHAGPHSTDGSMRKLSGNQRTIYEKERLYIANLPYEIVGVACMAARQLVPVHVGAGTLAVPGISVNRRERTDDGRTILGWNPDEPLDDELMVLKFAAADGQVLAVVVNFACHPVVLGGENANVGPDYPGALRSLVERNLGGSCLFLAGAGGNVLPLEGFHEDVETSVSAYVQALRIGDVAIVSLPGEPFNEIGRAVKDRSPVPATLFAGYSNGYIGYFPTAVEFPFGGYEPSYSHHNTHLLEQVTPESEGILVEACLSAIARAFR